MVLSVYILIVRFVMKGPTIYFEDLLSLILVFLQFHEQSKVLEQFVVFQSILILILILILI